jgi:uncharacterized protein
MTSTSRDHRLARETSPYLLQHADNPVDWYPWGEEALRTARERNCPILLSVGYSACHWCHVMAHESFEDVATAELMNRLFVNVKVDREERPDIDRIYQTAHHLLTQRPGGWPLTMFINPEDQRPFFGGTYFPKEARYGMPAFSDLLQRVAAFYKDQRDDVAKQSAQLDEIFAQLEPAAAGAVTFNDKPLAAAREKFASQFDREFGGLDGAPKFPHPAILERLLRHWRGTVNAPEPDIDALFLVSLTLKRMADGGIRDHLGGGFCRYSVDRYWQIPHFEKMLYDNGPLLAVYAQTALATGEPEFRQVANEIADWLLRRMRAPEGGFYSSLDADSEGEEGRYYVWTPEEVQRLLPDNIYAAFSRYFGLDKDPNFEGRWHLAVQEDRTALAEELECTQTELTDKLESARRTLLNVRQQRVPPGQDDKQLTSWNALAIRGLAIAGRALERPELTQYAQEAVDFLREHLLVDGRLLASYKDDRARFPAYLDDHAFLLDALLELLQNDWRTENLDLAIELAELLLEHFYDTENGGFWFTANDHEELMHRPKPIADEALPAGAGIAACALQRLGFLLGETRYLDAAEKTLASAWSAIEQYPHGHVSLLNALDEHLNHPDIVIIRGDGGAIDSWRDAAARLFAPRRLVFAIPAGTANLPGALAGRKAVDGKTLAYVCKGTSCDLPVESLESLASQLAGS